MSIPVFIFRAVLLSMLAMALPALGQNPGSNDGFLRRDGTMYVIRNGVKRPMTRDAHLPNGRIITRDGFVVARDGHRTELAEGKGCDLAGSSVAVATDAGGQLVLAAAPRPQTVAGQAVPASTYLRQLFGSGKQRGWGYYKKGKHGKGKKRKHDD